MTRLALLIPLAACGSGAAPQTTRVEPRVAPIAAPIVRTGRHAENIDVVAATEDGTAAVTQDNRGGTRLWPSLDGLREPVIIPMNRAQELHVGRTLTGFVIAGLDEAGGVEVIAVAESGRVQTRTRLAPEPAIVTIAVRGGELLALRADQAIEIIEATGRVRSRLPAPAGERVTAIVTRGAHALALLEGDRHTIRGTWIGQSAWGDPIATTVITTNVPAAGTALARPGDVAGEVARRGALRFAAAALSPSGTRLAVPFDLGVAVVDLQTATVSIDNDLFADRVELADDTTLTAFRSTMVRVRDLRSGSDTGETEVGVSPIRIGSRILSGAGDRLELCTLPFTRVRPHGVGPRVDVELVPASKQYLGYRIGALAGVRVTPTGLTVSGGTQDLVELGPDLQTSRRIELPADARTLKDTIRLDDRHVLATHAYSETSFAVSVIDTRARTSGSPGDNASAWSLTVEILSTPVLTPMLRYEPSTELLSITDSIASYLLRRNPATSKFETWFRVGAEPADLRVLDPAKTGGVVALVLREDAEPRRTRVERIRADKLVVGAPISGLETFYVGSPLGIDARGRIYVADGDALVAWDGDRELARVPGAIAPESRPRVVASGDHVALVQGERVSLFDDDGTPRWDTDAPGLRDVGWMGDELVAHFEGGLAKLDLDDGHVVGATCGWAFGLSDTPGTPSGEGASICEAP